MIVRAERPSDVESIRAVVAAAFGQPDEARLVDRLRADGDAVMSLVAEEDGRLVGHVLLSRLEAPFPALALAPVAVVPDRQRGSVGTALVRAAIERATSDGWKAIFVLGDAAYYGRFGFDAAKAAGVTSPYAGAHFMALPLGGPLPVASGDVRHAPAFAAL